MPSRSPSRVPAAFAEFEGDRQFATTLARGLELLRCFSPESPLLGTNELARRLGLPAPTVSRLAYTLVRMGYLVQERSDRKYRLGSTVLSLGYPLLELFTIRQQARPLMIELARETGGTVSMGIRDRLSIVCIEAVRTRQRNAYPIDVGTTHSLAGTAIGRACLMACTPDERTALLNQLRVKAPQEWARHAVRLQENLAAYARWGCCVSVGEIHPDVQAVAVPLGRIDRDEPAAINCSFQGVRLDETWLREEIGPRLLALARRLA